MPDNSGGGGIEAFSATLLGLQELDEEDISSTANSCG